MPSYAVLQLVIALLEKIIHLAPEIAQVVAQLKHVEAQAPPGTHQAAAAPTVHLDSPLLERLRRVLHP